MQKHQKVWTIEIVDKLQQKKTDLQRSYNRILDFEEQQTD